MRPRQIRPGAFQPRCRFALPVCETVVPELTEQRGEPGDHLAACHNAEGVAAAGAELGGRT